MGSVKPWQIVLFVVAIGALGFGAWNLVNSGPVNLTNSVLAVDVRTGQLFELDVSGRKSALFPERNPETNEYTLLPVEKTDDGNYHLKARARSDFEALAESGTVVVDVNTLRVDVQDTNARRITPG